MRKETAQMAAVLAAAIASWRHFQAPANHSTPTPGVTFVNSGKTKAAEYRNPMTMLAAMSRWMLPVVISSVMGECGMNSRMAASHGRAIQASTTRFRPIHADANTSHGRRVAGHTAWANAGEYRYVAGRPTRLVA
jgi:hypothetical protein